ncbi:hypothetical protein AMTRI_Chr04g183790 [Amborella trichopoda]
MIYCHKDDHKKDRYFILMAPQFTSKKYRQLLQMLQGGSLSHLASSLSHLANLANILCSSTFSSFNDTWIIDNEPSSLTSPMKLPNGNFVVVLHIAVVTLSGQITLHNVLCVPFFSYNLLYVQKLTFDLQCSITFFSNHCIIQDLLLIRTIGAGREHNGLYIFHPYKVVFVSPVHSSNPMDLW